ncbi:RNA ligase family protein [Massilia pseudoviolaceinigra]|uniref:RNA ligase family protein n=1 Tax=Massilia pseudoviolaceinigra TaxID=3057165 RepID=UPI002796D002|nr:RNA ligase family protein [Massilia sp. CCM 9206]MDQ1923327.1 RNA ligase family protein [Massilia sp. CCM 9206]
MTNFVHNLELHKYPSTRHLEGSQLQQGDDGFDKPGKRNDPRAAYAALAGRHIVVEEKLDGANAGVSFSEGAELLLQSRGHYLAGGGRERQFSIFKRWAAAHESALIERLGDRYVMYGEWMGKKHSVFYNHLPHLFCEFDIYDRKKGIFLSTAARAALLDDAPVLAVPVLYAGVAPRKLADLLAFIRFSLAKTPAWKTDFEATVAREGLDLAKCWAQADKSDLAEGLYIKVEEDGVVTARYKWVRSDFVQAILDSKMHHSQQPYVPNQLAPGVDIYAPRLTTTWEDLGLVTEGGK